MARTSPKTRLQSLPRRDRDEVQRLHQLFVDDERSCADQLRKKIRYDFLSWHRYTPCPQTHIQYHPPASAQKAMEARVHSLCNSMTGCTQNQGMVLRLIHNDPALQSAGLSLGSRFGFLGDTLGAEAEDQCYHVFPLLSALAARDDHAVKRFLERLPGPARKGHPTTRLLCNAICAVLRRDHTAFSRLEDELRTRKENLFYRAMYDCLLAIMHGSRDGVSSALLALAKASRKKKNCLTSMDRITCQEAHALYHLATDMFEERGVSAPDPPISESTWDQDYHVFMLSRPALDRTRLLDLAPLSPTLHRWIEKLPDRVDGMELMLEVLPAHAKLPPGQPYTKAELRELPADAVPYRSDLCPACDCFIPRFADLSKAVEDRLRSLGLEEAKHAVIEAVGCPERFADIWLTHPDGPRPVPVPLLPAAACPQCGKMLKTSKAKQCFHCGADWH